MKMRTFNQQKMWRDKIITHIETEGSVFHMRHLNEQEFDEQLRIKLLEETEEVRRASTGAELIEELADVFEVIDTLCTLHGISREEVTAVQHKKRVLRGGFERRIFIEKVEHPAGSRGEKYCLANPEKYPEIVE